MQRPTCTGLRVRSPSDAQVVFHAVKLNILPMVSRRLDTEERRNITSGCVFVWEERGPNAEATGLGIERWTDGIRWGPSRVRDEFLFYHSKQEEPPTEHEMASDSDSTSPSPSSSSRYGRGLMRDNLIKQTYSVFVETQRGRRKWHLIAYFTQDSIDYLRSIDDLPQLSSLRVPPGVYKSARSAKGRPRDPQSYDRAVVPVGPYPSSRPHPQYAPYSYNSNTTSRPSTTSNSNSSYPVHTRDPTANAQQPYHQQHEYRHGSSSPPSYHSLPPTDAASHPRVRSPSHPHQILAPLAYLQNLAPARRHPLDEKALMALQPDFA